MGRAGAQRVIATSSWHFAQGGGALLSPVILLEADKELPTPRLLGKLWSVGRGVPAQKESKGRTSSSTRGDRRRVGGAAVAAQRTLSYTPPALQP